MSHRTERVGNLIRGILAEAIQSQLNDPRLEPLTTITRVDVSGDLSLARVYVSVLAPESRRRLSVAALQQASKRLRGMVREHLVARTIPQLEFILDDSLRRGHETLTRLDEVMAEHNERSLLEPEGAAEADDEEERMRREARDAAPADEPTREREGDHT